MEAEVAQAAFQRVRSTGGRAVGGAAMANVTGEPNQKRQRSFKDGVRWNEST